MTLERARLDECRRTDLRLNSHYSLFFKAAWSFNLVSHDGDKTELLSRPFTLISPTPPGFGRKLLTTDRR
jgi:hypothetical protein